MYYETLIPDAKFIFKMTGVKLVDYSNRKLVEGEKLPFTCELKQRKRAVKNPCEVKKVKTPCPCEKPMMTINCSKPPSPCSTKARNAKEIIQTKPSTCIKADSDCKFSNPKTTHQECKSNSKCLKKSVKKTKSVECCKFPKEADDTAVNAVDNNNESPRERKNRSTALNAGGSSFNDGSNCDWTVSCSAEAISTREPDRDCSSQPNLKLISPDLVARVEPEEVHSASLHCSCSGVRKKAATPPRQSPRTTAAESVREPRREHHRTSENGGRVERRSASARSARSTSDDGRRIGRPCHAKDLQNRSCPTAFVQSCRASS